jgi:uncharacterized membrane protein YbhN (UPF0104 family)
VQVHRPSGRIIATSLVALLVFCWCVYYVVSTFSWSAILPVMARTRLFFFLATTGVTLLAYWALRSLRWRVLLDALKEPRIPFSDLYLCCSSALAFAIITPFQTGEMLKIELLKRHGLVGRFVGYSSFFVERVFDLTIVLSLALVGSVYGLDLGVSQWAIAVVWVVCISIAALAFVAIAHIRPRGRLASYHEQFRACITSGRVLIKALGASIIAWFIVALGWHFSLLSIGVEQDFMATVGMMAVVALLCVFSFIPGAVGVSEASIAAVMIHFGHPTADAQASALILRCYMLWQLALGGAHALIWNFTRPVGDSNGREL